MYPKLVVNLKKLEDNLNAVATITKDHGNCVKVIF